MAVDTRCPFVDTRALWLETGNTFLPDEDAKVALHWFVASQGRIEARVSMSGLCYRQFPFLSLFRNVQIIVEHFGKILNLTVEQNKIFVDDFVCHVDVGYL